MEEELNYLKSLKNETQQKQEVNNFETIFKFGIENIY